MTKTAKPNTATTAKTACGNLPPLLVEGSFPATFVLDRIVTSATEMMEALRVTVCLELYRLRLNRDVQGADPAVIPPDAQGSIKVHIGCVLLPVLELTDPAVIPPDALGPIGGHLVARMTEEEMEREIETPVLKCNLTQSD